MVFLLFVFTLSLHCLALEGDGQIQISFKIWSPILMDLDRVEEVVSGALRSYFCQETRTVLLDSNFKNACEKDVTRQDTIVSEDAKLLMLDFIKTTDPDRSFLFDEATNVLISAANENNGTIKGTIWDLEFDVLQIGKKDIGRARMANFANEIDFLEFTIQQRLNSSIAEGTMNERFRGTEIVMGQLGQGIETLSESPLVFKDENNMNTNDSSKLSYAESALILRYIGIAMLAGSFFVHFILLCCGRRYRLERNLKELEALDPDYQRGLITEEGVNLMLEKGRRESTDRMPSSSQTV